MALGVDKNDEKNLMERPPRKAEESLFANGGWTVTAFYGILIAFISLTAFFTVPWNLMQAQGIKAGGPADLLEYIKAMFSQKDVLLTAQTYAFTVLGMSQLFHAIGMRDVYRSVFVKKLWENQLMILALAAGFSLQVLVTEVPFLVNAFSTAKLSLQEWAYLIGLSAFPLLAHEIFVALQRWKRA